MTAHDDAERAAIEHAKAQFRYWRRPQGEPTQVRRAARALLAALPPLDADAPATFDLLTLMQSQPPHGAKEAIVAELVQLRSTLQRIDAATVPVKGIRDDDAANWIAHAADAWVEFTGKLPSSGEESRFLLALQEQADPAPGPVDIPKVTRDQLREVLPRWRAFRG